MPKSQISVLLRRLLPLAGLLVLVVFFAIKIPRGPDGENLFLSSENIFNIARQQSAILLIAFGMTLVIISGGIDLSVGSVSAFSGMVTALLIHDKGVALAPAMAIGVVAGAFCGLINAFLIGILRLPPFIATLGTMGIARGVTNIISGGRSIGITADGIRWLGEADFLRLDVCGEPRPSRCRASDLRCLADGLQRAGRDSGAAGSTEAGFGTCGAKEEFASEATFVCARHGACAAPAIAQSIPAVSPIS